MDGEQQLLISFQFHETGTRFIIVLLLKTLSWEGIERDRSIKITTLRIRNGNVRESVG